ncbi:MAG: methyltransferase family protein [Gammaproteobacteria bacterium]
METELGMGVGLGYGHWGWVLFNSLSWLVVSFFLVRPRRLREQLAWLLLALFLIDEFVELYGAPLTLSVFSRWLAEYPRSDQLAHRAGDLWRILFGEGGQPATFDFYHIGGGIMIFSALAVLALAWQILKLAQLNNMPATLGPYAIVRHPQYLALIVIMAGFIVQGPTIPTLLLFPLISYLYLRFARIEEREAAAKFGDAYVKYAARTPRFIPANKRRLRL